MAKIKLSVIIPTYNREDLLKKCLEKLLKQTYPQNKFEVIVVDDGSADNTEKAVTLLQGQFPNLYYLKATHQGMIKARNVGIKKAQGEIIAFIDDDCLAEKDWLEKLDDAFKKHPHALGVEGKTVTYSEIANPFTSQIENTKGGAYQTCNIAYKKDILMKISLFDEDLPALACEDIDLALRVLKLGPIIFEPKATVTHLPRKTNLKKEFQRLKTIKSEFYLFLKHPDYFKEKYGNRPLFFQVIFVNSIWIRLFHLKHYSYFFNKRPWLYLAYVIRTAMEVFFIMILIPSFWTYFRQIKNEKNS